MKENPLISIVIPSFNSERFIADTLYTLEQQSYKHFEVIISDGGSIDSTLNLVTRASLPSVLIDSRTDRGVPDALNRGFEMATGEILCWLNSDDLYTSRNTLEYVADTFQKEEIDFAFGHMMSIDVLGEITGLRYAHLPLKRFQTHGNNLFTGSLFFKKMQWDSFGGFSEKYAYAFEYEIIRHLFNHGKGKLINQILCAFRIHQSGISSRLNVEMNKETLEFFKDRKHIPKMIVKMERLTSQFLQGTLSQSLAGRVNLSKRKVNWKQNFQEHGK